MPRPAAHRVIYLRPDAPAKPSPSQPCNGCGVCCATTPCPLGKLISRRLDGPCQALQWQAGVSNEAARYRCGALAEPQRWLPWLPARWSQALVRRWIAAGQGCDCDLEAMAG